MATFCIPCCYLYSMMAAVPHDDIRSLSQTEARFRPLSRTPPTLSPSTYAGHHHHSLPPSLPHSLLPLFLPPHSISHTLTPPTLSPPSLTPISYLPLAQWKEQTAVLDKRADVRIMQETRQQFNYRKIGQTSSKTKHKSNSSTIQNIR